MFILHWCVHQTYFAISATKTCLLKHSIANLTVAQEMPSWISDSQYQRVEWFNSLLTNMWPQLSVACEAAVKEQVQPVLDAQCPLVLGKLQLDRFSMGNISPKIIGECTLYTTY